MTTGDLEGLHANLAEANRKMEIIQKVSVELNKVVTLPEKLNGILSILDHQFGVGHSLILLPEASRKQLTVYASHGYDGNNIGRTVIIGEGLAGMAAERKRHINLTGIRRKQHDLAAASGNNEADFLNTIGLTDAESQFAIPLISNDELVAVLVAESRNFCVFSPADERFLITLAQPLAVSIQNAMLYEEMEARIRERTAELQKLNQTKDKFFSIISHDLRGPIASFQGLTRLFTHYHKTGQSEKFESLCAKVDQSVGNLSLLLENLLDWSLSQTQGLQTHIEPIALDTFLYDMIEIYRIAMASKEIVFANTVGPHVVLADSYTLATVLRNLVSNAIKFTPRGGAITISSQENGASTSISIRDSGCGMNREKLEKLFELGTRRSSGTEKEKGTGLGLILVKEFVALNQGDIQVTSDSSGTIVTVTLPSAKTL
jgi:signal transduction histidine kinase